ncbi:MAG: hypothetical protein HYU67_09200 [Flavobacteriia bacterium]|nr:hypothetical protein [Flavobacteriia bacterium]
MQSFEIVQLNIAGFSFQEPMALLTNWFIAAFCFIVYFFTPWAYSTSSESFKKFYLFLGLSTFLGGFGHFFYQYTGMLGKNPSWIFAVFAGFYIGKGILVYWRDNIYYAFWHRFLFFKSLFLLLLTLSLQKFVFVAIDAILTYVLYSGFIAWRISIREKKEMKYFVYGMFILFPSAFIFLMDINLHRYLNRDDLSHVLMFFCIIFFYFGVRISNKKYLLNSTSPISQ